MKRLFVLIEGQSKEIELDESFIITHENPYLLIKKATGFWNYNNITSLAASSAASSAASDLEIIYNDIKKTIKEGYWTFDMLKKEIESYGNVILEANKHNGKCSITSDSVINLKNLGPLLGFHKDQSRHVARM